MPAECRQTGRRVCKLSGYAPAIPTPFDHLDAVDGASLERFCDLQIREGATALVVCGTTGEASTLGPQERDRIIRIAVDVANGRVPLIAGTSSNSTSRAIELTKAAKASGADAILSVVPYYNKPTQAGLYAHFREIACTTDLPILLYDVPSRSACSLADETIARLAELPRIIGLKDATGNCNRLSRLRALVGRDFRLLSGDDATALAFLAHGGHGCISVTSNIAPGLCLHMYAAFRQGQMDIAQHSESLIAELTAALFRESNPAPLKYALSLLGMMSPRVRLPLVEPSNQTRSELEYVVRRLQSRYAEQLIGGSCHPSAVRQAASHHPRIGSRA